MGSILRNNFAQPSHFADEETPYYFRQPIGVFTFLIVFRTVASRFEICITVLGKTIASQSVGPNCTKVYLCGHCSVEETF